MKFFYLHFYNPNTYLLLSVVLGTMSSIHVIHSSFFLVICSLVHLILKIFNPEDELPTKLTEKFKYPTIKGILNDCKCSRISSSQFILLNKKSLFPAMTQSVNIDRTVNLIIYDFIHRLWNHKVDKNFFFFWNLFLILYEHYPSYYWGSFYVYRIKSFDHLCNPM